MSERPALGKDPEWMGCPVPQREALTIFTDFRILVMSHINNDLTVRQLGLFSNGWKVLYRRHRHADGVQSLQPVFGDLRRNQGASMLCSSLCAGVACLVR